MKFRVPGLLGGHVYSTWEEAYNNCPDGREGAILVEMTIINYKKLMRKIESQTEEIRQLRNVINNMEFQNREKKKELMEKDRRCASLAAAVNRLKSKKQKGGIA